MTRERAFRTTSVRVTPRDDIRDVRRLTPATQKSWVTVFKIRGTYREGKMTVVASNDD